MKIRLTDNNDLLIKSVCLSFETGRASISYSILDNFSKEESVPVSIELTELTTQPILNKVQDLIESIVKNFKK